MKMFRQFHRYSLGLQMMHLYWSFAFLFFTGFAWAQDKRVDAKKLYEQGEEAHNAGNYKLALDYFNKCLKESPGFADAYFTRGATREQLQDLSGANTDYNI